jgi:predicted ATPase
VPEPSHDLSAEAAGEVRIDSPRHNLPAPVDSFVGRERELSEVQGMLRDPAVRMVTLVGMGGMGKTRLALEAARSLLTAFADGVWLVDLAPLPTIPPRGRTNATAPEDSVERAIARVLQVNPETTTDLTARIVLALQGRELLLVMDNCEHVLEDAVPALARLLSSCPALTVLATSREPLRVAGEHLYEIPALGFPADTEDLELGDVLRAYSAVQLFAQRAAAARYGVAVDGDNLEPAIAICRLLDGMPLAIELAAARLSAMAMTELAGALASSRPATGHGEERWSLLSAGSRAAHPRQRALQATVAWSYNLLEEQERLLFDRLSVFSGTFDLDAVAWVCGDGLAESGMPAPDMIPASLAALVDCSLVQRVQVEGDVLRYRLLETLRVYALERLAERGETYATSWRHADYYLQLTESQETALRTNTPEAVDILFRLDEERDNLAAAIRWCLAHGRAETAARIAGAVEWWAMYHTHLEEYAAYVRRALEHEFELPPLVRAKAWDLIALYAFNWGRNEEFAAAAKAELQAAREAEDGYWMGWAVSRQGMHALVTGDDRRAEALLRQSREIWHEYGEQGHTAMHETLLARYQPPGERLRYAERVLPASPNPCNAYLFQMAGVMAYLDGYLERAEALRRTAVKLWADLGNRTMEGALCASLGAVCLMRGAGADEVLGFGQRATRVARTSGHLPAYIERQWEYGDMLWHLGRLPEALHALEEALAQALHHGEQGLARQIRESLAQVHLEREDLPAAQAACDAVPGSQDDDASVRLLDARGRMAALRGDTAGAVRLMRLALEGARGWTVRPDVAIATEHVGWALAENGELDEAASLLAEAQSERDAMGMVLYPVEVPHHERAVATVEGRA